jgi:hypothetical protein
MPRAPQKTKQEEMAMLKEFITVIGPQAAHKLVADFGGRRLYVPQLPHPDDPISTSIGFLAATKLARIYGSDRVEIPNPPPRRMQILALRAVGCSVDAIASQLRCTRRRVFQVLAESRTAAALNFQKRIA